MGNHDQATIGKVSIYVPTGAVETTAKMLAPRLKTVRGARIGILDNCKEFADLVLRGVAEILKRDHGVKEITFWRKDYLGKPAAFVKEMAAASDAVINGVGH
jgi:hypothetical protein